MKYAVAFTTYSWDGFVARQFDRLQHRVKSGDIYVVADESHGVLDGITADRVIRTTQTEILRRDGCGPFVEKYPVGVKSALWWNLDYLTYKFFSEHQKYDYCLMMDYDAYLNVDIDDFVLKVAERRLDFVAHRHIDDVEKWMWTKPHRQTYRDCEIDGRLLCVAVISREASNYLMQRRREMALAYTKGEVPFWPFCEVFMPVELELAGFRLGDLRDFCNLDRYGWRPAYREDVIAEVGSQSVVHPVLDDVRLLRSLMAEHYPFSDILRPGSSMRQQLRPYSASAYIPFAVKEVRKRLMRRMRTLVHP